MRSIEEIDADIAAVQARIAKRNEGMPNYGDPGYRAARFDYIVEGDRSGLDAYQNALNAAIQNKLSRDSAEKMAKAGKSQASLEENDDIMLHLSDADAIVDDLKKRNYADDSLEMRKAKNQLDHWVKRAERKGIDVSLYKEAPKAAPVATNAPAPAQANAAPNARTYEQIASDIDALASDSSANIDRVNALEGELQLHKDTVPYARYTESLNKVNEKKKSIGDSTWNEYNSRVKAALSEKDYGKRKAALEPLKKELPSYKGQEKYAEVEKSINDGLKKPATSPVVGYIKNIKPRDLESVYLDLRNKKEGEKSKTINAPIGDRSYPYKAVLNNDGSLTVSGGGYSRKFKKEDFSEHNVGAEIKVPTERNAVANTLLRDDTKTIKFGRAPVSED